ncbi:MAG: SGNH/GDSL hydrolase family protein [Nocardioides sp.]|nr:SGNH/GDSL hydrolase family protein [Nocardioides sp.]
MREGAVRRATRLGRGWLAAALLATPLLVVPPSGAEGTESYVALGDSFVSGPGILPQQEGGCSRSTRNFPSLVAAGLGATAFTDASCSGAKLSDLWVAQGTNAPQLDQIGPDTTLVTFGTLGGNDLGMVDFAVSCFMGTCSGEPGDARHQAVEDLGDVIRAGIAEVKTRAPQADIVVVGYSHYIPATSCPAVGSIDAAEATYFQGLIDHLSAVLQAAAIEAGAAFANMNTIPGVAEHTVCAPPEQQWVRAIETYNDGYPLHPSSCGMNAYAQQVMRALQAHRGQPVDAFVDPCPAPLNEPVDPIGPDRDLDAVVHAEQTTRLRARCTTGRVVLRVRGGEGLVRRAAFRIGDHRIKIDREAPFTVRRPARRLASHRGKLRARVTVAAGDVRRIHVLQVRRPRCLR